MCACVSLRDEMILLYARRGGRPRCRWVITRLIVLRNNIIHTRTHYTPVCGGKEVHLVRIVLFHFVAHIPFLPYYYYIFFFHFPLPSCRLYAKPFWRRPKAFIIYYTDLRAPPPHQSRVTNAHVEIQEWAKLDFPIYFNDEPLVFVLAPIE